MPPIDLSGLSDDASAVIDDALATLGAGVEDPADLAVAMLPLLEGYEDLLLGFEPCTEESWSINPELPAECFLVDQELLYTFLLADLLDKIMNLWAGEGPEGDHALGILTSAFVFRPAL